MKTTKCNKCGSFTPGAYYDFKYGVPISSQTSTAQEGIHTATRTTTTYQILGSSGATICDNCITRRNRFFRMCLPVGALFAFLGLLSWDFGAWMEEGSSPIFFPGLFSVPPPQVDSSSFIFLSLFGFFGIGGAGLIMMGFSLSGFLTPKSEHGVAMSWKLRRKKLLRKNSAIEKLE